jgi:dihydroxyacetone kinase-like predicted kinase
MDVGVLKRTPKEHIHEHTATPLVEKLRQAGRANEIVIDTIAVTHDELPEPEPPMLEAEFRVEEDE